MAFGHSFYISLNRRRMHKLVIRSTANVSSNVFSCFIFWFYAMSTFPVIFWDYTETHWFRWVVRTCFYFHVCFCFSFIHIAYNFSVITLGLAYIYSKQFLGKKRFDVVLYLMVALCLTSAENPNISLAIVFSLLYTNYYAISPLQWTEQNRWFERLTGGG